MKPEEIKTPLTAILTSMGTAQNFNELTKIADRANALLQNGGKAMFTKSDMEKVQNAFKANNHNVESKGHFGLQLTLQNEFKE